MSREAQILEALSAPEILSYTVDDFVISVVRWYNIHHKRTPHSGGPLGQSGCAIYAALLRPDTERESFDPSVVGHFHEITPAILEKMGGCSIKTARKGLSNLEEHGFVKTEKIGRNLFAAPLIHEDAFRDGARRMFALGDDLPEHLAQLVRRLPFDCH